MQETTFTELRNHAKDYFDAVEGGDTVRVFRNGKPIAKIMPIAKILTFIKTPINRNKIYEYRNFT